MFHALHDSYTTQYRDAGSLSPSQPSIHLQAINRTGATPHTEEGYMSWTKDLPENQGSAGGPNPYPAE